MMLKITFSLTYVFLIMVMLMTIITIVKQIIIIKQNIENVII